MKSSFEGFVAVDWLANIILATPLRKYRSAPEAASLFFDVIYKYYGRQIVVFNDIDPFFTKKKLGSTLCRKLKINVMALTAYQPKTDKRTEIVKWKLIDVIRIYDNCNKFNWIEILIHFEVV